MSQTGSKLRSLFNIANCERVPWRLSVGLVLDFNTNDIQLTKSVVLLS